MKRTEQRKRDRSPTIEQATTEVSFRRLVRLVAASCATDIKTETSRLCVRFGIENSDGSGTRDRLLDLLEDAICGALNSEPESELHLDSRALRQQLLVRHFVDQQPVWPHLGILNALRSAAREKGIRLPALRLSDAWKGAVKNAMDMHLLQFTDFDALMIRRRNSRQHAVAEGILELRRAGYRVSVVGGRAQFAPGEEQRLAHHIEGLLQADAISIAHAVFLRLSAMYNSQQRRYHFPRRHGITQKLREGSIPFAYLLNLCAKHATVSTGRRHKFDDAVTLATSYAAALDIESYAIHDIIYNTGQDLPRYLTDLATFDGMFALTQFRPTDVRLVLHGLFDWLEDARAKAILGWTIGDAIAVANRVLTIKGDDPHRPRVFTENEVSQRLLNIRRPVVHQILRTYAHQRGRANRDFLLPHDQRAANFSSKPLITLDDGRYVLLNRSWCAPAFYEAIRDAVQDGCGHSPNGEIGMAFERMIHGLLQAHGVTTHAGKYAHRGLVGDCDVVVETDKSIVLLELKIKALIRVSRSGYDVNLLLDVAQSLLDAQAQLAKHELVLRQNGHIDLKSDGSTHRLEHSGREILRVAMTLLDFGAIQNRDTLRQIMSTFAASSMTSNAPEYADAMRKIEGSAHKFREWSQKLREIRPIDGDEFYNCSFVSLGQLLVMLDIVGSNEQFGDAVRMDSALSTGTLDQYHEFAFLEEVKRVRDSGVTGS